MYQHFTLFSVKGCNGIGIAPGGAHPCGDGVFIGHLQRSRNEDSVNFLHQLAVVGADAENLEGFIGLELFAVPPLDHQFGLYTVKTAGRKLYSEELTGRRKAGFKDAVIGLKYLIMNLYRHNVAAAVASAELHLEVGIEDGVALIRHVNIGLIYDFCVYIQVVAHIEAFAEAERFAGGVGDCDLGIVVAGLLDREDKAELVFGQRLLIFHNHRAVMLYLH